MKQRNFLAGALVIAMALLIQACGRQLDPEEPCHFVQNHQLQRVSWKGEIPVKLSLHSSVPYKYHSAIQGAVGEWNRAFGREVLRIELTGVNGASLPRRDGANMIYWFKTWEPDRHREQARTTVYWAGHRIHEADIRLNAQDFSFYNGRHSNKDFSGVDMESLMVHELGHVLGLSHNSEQGSVMNAILPSNTLRRKPSPIDLASMRCEY